MGRGRWNAWWAQQDSNLQPRDYESPAPPLSYRPEALRYSIPKPTGCKGRERPMRRPSRKCRKRHEARTKPDAKQWGEKMAKEGLQSVGQAARILTRATAHFEMVAWLSGRASPSHGGGHRFKSCSDHHETSRSPVFGDLLFSRPKSPSGHNQGTTARTHAAPRKRCRLRDAAAGRMK